MKMILTLLALSSSIILAGCEKAPETVENAPTGNAVVGIVPPRGAPRTSYCQLNGNELVLTFFNSGQIPAQGTVNVTVDFGVSNASLPMPVIQPGTSVDMNFSIPNGCFSPDCSFNIKWSNQPPVSGRCIG